MRRARLRPTALAAVLAACGPGDATHDCDAGTPTCDSSLRVLLPDSRSDFQLTVEFLDGTLAGTSLAATCPSAAPLEEGDVTAYCGAGQLTLEAVVDFSDQVRVRLEETTPETYTPDWQRGSDFCLNPCTIGSIQL